MPINTKLSISVTVFYGIYIWSLISAIRTVKISHKISFVSTSTLKKQEARFEITKKKKQTKNIYYMFTIFSGCKQCYIYSLKLSMEKGGFNVKGKKKNV